MNSGILTLPWRCDEAENRTGDTFRQVTHVSGTEGAVNQTTVAVWKDSAILKPHDKILLIGHQAGATTLGTVKTVKDECPACLPNNPKRMTDREKIANYSLSQECTARKVGGDLGTFKTIRLR